MRSDDSLGRRESGSNTMNGDHRGVGCQNRRRGTRRDQVGEYLLFEFESFRRGFGDVIRALDRLREITIATGR